jgi:CheY-like chemotaxis protein
VLGLVGEILRLRGYSVLEASGADAASAILEDHSIRIDAIVTDVVMPKVNGREFLRHAAALRPGLPALLMSGYAGQGAQTLGAELGPRIGFIPKPFTPGVLLEKLREVLSGTAPGPAKARQTL